MKHNGQTFFRIGLLSSLLLACVCLLCSCFSFGTYPPPGFAKENDALRIEGDHGVEAAYSLLIWHVSCYSGDVEPASSVKAAIARISEDIFAGQSSSAEQRFAPILRIENGIPTLNPKSIGQELDADKARTMLDDIIALYSKPALVVIPIEECMSAQIWRRYGKKHSEHFRKWAEEKKALPFDEPDSFSRKKLIHDAERIIKLLELRQSLQKIVKDCSVNIGDDLEKVIAALDSVEKAALPLEQGYSLDELGCGQLQKDFLALKTRLPLEYIRNLLDKAEGALSNELDRLLNLNRKYDDAAEKALCDLEESLNAALSKMKKDARFKDALDQQGARLDGLLLKMGTLRKEIWTGAIDELGQSGKYWEAWLFYVKCVEQLESRPENRLAVFSSVIRKLPVCFGVELAYRALLPEAVKKYTEAARQAQEIANKPAIAYAICSMMDEMCSVPLTDALLELNRDVKRQLKLARERMLNASMRRYFSIENLSSAIPGIGITYRLDLENELVRLLNAFGLGDVVLVNVPNEKNADYHSQGGNVANFEGNESVERQSIRTVIRFMESRRMENPEYQKDAEGTQDRRHGSRVLFQQDKVRQVIHLREIERQAHIRVFFTFVGPGFSEHLELNEFYSKFFRIEESHPINDMLLLRTINYYDEAEVPKASGELELKYDRVWTPGQMLDWARKDSISSLALPLLYYINDYPLYLKKKIEGCEALDIAKKTELWAKCSLLCDLQKVGDETELLNGQLPVIARLYGKYLDLLRRQRRVIFSMRNEAAKNMRQSAYEYVQEKEVR